MPSVLQNPINSETQQTIQKWENADYLQMRQQWQSELSYPADLCYKILLEAAKLSQK